MASLLLLAIGYRLSAVSGALARYGALWGAIFYTALAAKTIQPPCGRENASPFGGWRHHLARWEACHLILSRLRLLANQVPLPPGGKHVTGFAGRLQLPYESSSFATPAVRLVNQKEGPFMGRLRAYFDQLAHPMQDVHSGTITRAYCRAIYEESASRCFILPPLAGEVRRSRKGGGERSEPIRRMLFMPYDIESQSRNADFILIAR